MGANLERNDKAAIERRQKNTCNGRAYEHNNYGGRLIYNTNTCSRHRVDIRYHTWDRRRGFQASSFRLSAGCKQVQLWDEDACRYGYGDNDNIRSSVGSVKWDLNDDICGISVWSKC